MRARTWLQGVSRVGVMALLSGCMSTASSAAPVVDIPRPAEPSGSDAPVDAAGGPPTVLGHWSGVGHQSSGGSWEMVVDVVGHAPGVCAHVRYPTLRCAAEWVCVEGSGRRALLAREHVTEGHDACVDGGDLTMKLTSNGRAAWSWSGAGESARAVLSRP